MSKHAILAIALAATLAIPAAASAQSGFFVDGGLGQARVDESGFKDKDTHFRLGGGWNLNPYFGLEAGWTDLGSFSEEVAIGGATAGFDADGWYAGIRGKIPFHDGDSGFFASARAGMLFWDASGRVRVGTITERFSDSGSDAYYGLGVGYDQSRNLGVSLNHDRYKLDRDGSSIKAWTVNATYRF
jgi:hypothetical protein